MKEIRWTEDAERHIWRHGVSPAEVEDAAYGRPRFVARGREGTRLIFGRTSAGRYLLVVMSEFQDGADFCVTARDMTANERRTYKRRSQWG